MDMQAERTWIIAIKQGNQTAFQNIVEAYQRPIYNLCYRMLNDATAAEDAAQEVFLRAYHKLDTYNADHKFSTWLYAIASHYCLDQLKRRRLQLISLDALPSWQQIPSQPSTQPERLLLQAEANSEVQNLLSSLCPAYRLPIVLKYWYGMSCEEIAQTLNISVSAVKSKLFRARQTMAQTLKRQQTDNQPVINSRETSFGRLTLAGAI